MLLKGKDGYYFENKDYICPIIKCNRYETDKYIQPDITINYTLRI